MVPYGTLRIIARALLASRWKRLGHTAFRQNLLDLKICYKQKLQEQATAEHTLAQQTSEQSNTTNIDPNQHLMDVFKQLTRVMKDSNTSDATDPSPFSGSDEKWDEFYAQLRTHLPCR